MHACTLTSFVTHPLLGYFLPFSSSMQMKFFSACPLGLALALLACTACASSEPTNDMDPTTLKDKLVDAFEALGAESEVSVSFLPKVDSKSIIAAERLTLTLVDDAVEGTPNEDAKAIFSWVATETHIAWKLSLFNIEDFTGSHLHLGPEPPGPIVQNLVPELDEGTFIEPINIPESKFYVGSFDISQIKEELTDVSSIRDFVTDYISEDEIYINVHGPEKVPIIRGFLSA